MKKIVLLLLLIVFTLSACQRKDLILVTTTSLENSGLLDYLIPHFEQEHNIKISVIAVGTGAALRYGERGMADLLIVHDVDKEIDFIHQGFGLSRSPWLYNDFIIVGPHTIEHTALEDLLETTLNNHHFYSRGDASGTHAKELSLWDSLKIDPTLYPNHYFETGQSMEATLLMASQKGYYTLTDRSTFLFMQEQLNLTIVYENPTLLINPYSIIEVNPDLHNRSTYYANLLHQWLLSEEAYTLISQYKIQDEPLFHRHP